MSSNSDLPKSVRRVTVIQGDGASRTVFKKSKDKKSQSFMLKPFERVHRRMAEAMKEGAAEYLDRHERSNEKKKNGWVKDMGDNVYKANRKAMKKARKAMPGMG
ncbi:MAG: hypothetical protein H6739_38200 [Alphaproteobacteria bacterium]|nr:hypothetical protein [Alphaproteobacteria bacterium]